MASTSHSSRAAGRRSTGRVVPCVLTIAGSDSGGGAGVQADLKAFARCGVHGACAVTAITVQNTVAVSAVHAVPGEIIVGQVRAVQEDMGVDAVKVGMLGTVEVAVAVAEALRNLPSETPVVVDPVMASESGASLMDAEARAVLVAEILPRATVVTPNVPEAEALAGATSSQAGVEDARVQELARAVHRLGPKFVVVTGGHREAVTDVFFDGEDFVSITGERHPDGAAHGSGCTHSSVLAAQLALGLEPLAAVRAARRIASEAVRDGLTDLGRGAGPVDVFGLTSRAMKGHLP